MIKVKKKKYIYSSSSSFSTSCSYKVGDLVILYDNRHLLLTTEIQLNRGYLISPIYKVDSIRDNIWTFHVMQPLAEYRTYYNPYNIENLIYIIRHHQIILNESHVTVNYRIENIGRIIYITNEIQCKPFKENEECNTCHIYVKKRGYLEEPNIKSKGNYLMTSNNKGWDNIEIRTASHGVNSHTDRPRSNHNTQSNIENKSLNRSNRRLDREERRLFYHDLNGENEEQLEIKANAMQWIEEDLQEKNSVELEDLSMGSGLNRKHGAKEGEPDIKRVTCYPMESVNGYLSANIDPKKHRNRYFIESGPLYGICDVCPYTGKWTYTNTTGTLITDAFYIRIMNYCDRDYIIKIIVKIVELPNDFNKEIEKITEKTTLYFGKSFATGRIQELGSFVQNNGNEPVTVTLQYSPNNKLYIEKEPVITIQPGQTEYITPFFYTPYMRFKFTQETDTLLKLNVWYFGITYS